MYMDQKHMFRHGHVAHKLSKLIPHKTSELTLLSHNHVFYWQI